MMIVRQRKKVGIDLIRLIQTHYTFNTIMSIVKGLFTQQDTAVLVALWSKNHDDLMAQFKETFGVDVEVDGEFGYHIDWEEMEVEVHPIEKHENA